MADDLIIILSQSISAEANLITKIEVKITPKIDDPEVRKRADQCKKMFENYCTVTASVREGINVEVNLDY